MCFQQTVKADFYNYVEDIDYIYMQRYDETEAYWYKRDASTGISTQIDMKDIIEGPNNYYIDAIPTLEVISYLNSLEDGSITFGTLIDGNITLGSSEIPFKLNFNMCSDKLNLTVYTDTIDIIRLDRGTLTINGNINTLYLGNGESTATANIDGNVSSLYWYRYSNQHTNNNLSLTGTVTNGYIIDRRQLSAYGSGSVDNSYISYTFADATGDIIYGNVLADSVVCNETDSLSAEIVYRVVCNQYNWYMTAWENNEKYIMSLPIGSSFKPADLKDDAIVSVRGNVNGEAIVIPKSIKKLSIEDGCDVIVEGNLEDLTIQWDEFAYEDDTTSHIDLTVNGAIENADISITEELPVSVTVNGVVKSGLFNDTKYFCDEGLIVKDGLLQVPAYTTLDKAQNKDAMGYIFPSADDLTGTTGISDADNIVDELGNVLASKKAEFVVADNTTMDEAAQAAFETKNNVEILDILDVQVVSSWYSAETGELYVDDTHKSENIYELSTPIELVFSIPQDAQDSNYVFSIIREHDGVYDVLADTDSDPATVTVLTDKFSAYMLVKSDSLPEISIEPVVSPVVGFVTRMYQQCLSRDPDQSGLEGWVGQLEIGNMNGADIAQAFVFSQEMLDKNLSNEDFIKVLYTSMMGREADTEGLKGWLGQLDNKYMTRSEVTKAFVESTEFTNICSSYGIIRGTYDASMAPIEHFVTRFYTLCLERNADQAGLYGWVGNLKNRYMNGAQIADSFFFSTEFTNKDVSDDKYVELLYNTLMGRASDENGKAGWVNQLQGGYMTRKDMMKAFIESDEFTGICVSYGITRGSL